MLFTTKKINENELKTVTNFFEEFDSEIKVVDIEEPQETTCVNKYISSLVSGKYSKSVEDIANTKIGNRIHRRRSFQQVMQESFFYGANRFGNNFIA